jgi:hypothetical protein
LTENQKKELTVIRKTLRERQVQKDLAPRLVTLDAKEMPLEKVLAEVAKQTGIEVVDRREAEEETRVKLKLEKAPFWEALDKIAQEIDARLGLYERDGKIALHRRPNGFQSPPVSSNGPFRTTIRRLTAIRNLEAEESYYVATLEVAWEPRFRPFLLNIKPADLHFQDDKNQELSLEQKENKISVSNKTAVTFDVPWPSLPRSAAKLGRFEGKVFLTASSQMVTFAFESTLAEQLKNPKAREMSRGGTTVKITQLDLAKDHWTVGVEIDYPADSPEFESFESWLIFNEMTLRKKESGEVFPNNGNYQIDSSGGNKAVVSYHFVDEPAKKLVRGNPEDWTVVYKTPGQMLEMPVTFLFKDVSLP